jgi:uncharacterized protein (TIGR03083 family)
MTELQSLVGQTYEGLAALLASAPAETWDARSLCEGWRVRHVVAHVTMPVRVTPEQFGAEMAAAGGDFAVLSNAIAARHASLPPAEHLKALQCPQLHEWEPPGGGKAGALSHAVIHSLDITIAIDKPPVAPTQALTAVLDQLIAANGAFFDVDLTGARLEAVDADWSWGSGDVVRTSAGHLVALLSGRTLPDGRAFQRTER